MGNIRNYNTYVPPQDKNKLFWKKKLTDIAAKERKNQFDDIIQLSIYKDIKNWLNL